jgi:hypothetical protein
MLCVGIFLKAEDCERVSSSVVLVFFIAVTYTGSSVSHCALMKGVQSDVHERLYRPEPI